MDFSALSEKRPEVSFEDMPAESLLPSDYDLRQLLLNVEVLVSRILAEHLPQLNRLSPVVVKHIPHKYSAEMSQKSQVVRISMHLFSM